MFEWIYQDCMGGKIIRRKSENKMHLVHEALENVEACQFMFTVLSMMKST